MKTNSLRSSVLIVLGVPRAAQIQFRMSTTYPPFMLCPSTMGRHSRVKQSTTVSIRMHAPVEQRVGHKVHTPKFVDMRARLLVLMPSCRLLGSWSFQAQRQSLVPVDPANVLYIASPSHMRNALNALGLVRPGLAVPAISQISGPRQLISSQISGGEISESLGTTWLAAAIPIRLSMCLLIRNLPQPTD